MSNFLVTTPVQAITCHRCGRLLLTGWVEGLHARVDPTPLNQTQEIAALLANKWTYTLLCSGLVHRDATRIRDPKLNGPILAEHKCAIPLAELCGATPKPEAPQ